MSSRNTSSLSTEDVSEHLSHLSRRRQVFRTITLTQLRAFITDAQRVLDERLEEEERAREEEVQKQERIKQHLELLRQDGITPGDISPFLKKKKPSKGPVKKYLIDGEVITYKGAGRMPAKLKALEQQIGREGLAGFEVKDD